MQQRNLIILVFGQLISATGLIVFVTLGWRFLYVRGTTMLPYTCSIAKPYRPPGIYGLLKRGSAAVQMQGGP